MKRVMLSIFVLVFMFFATAAIAADGAAIYGAKCQMCHGVSGAGGAMGPKLANTDYIKGDASHIKDAVKNGISAEAKKYPNFPMAMPKVALSEAELDAVVKYLKGL